MLYQIDILTCISAVYCNILFVMNHTQMWEALPVGGTSFRKCGKYFLLAGQASANVGSTSCWRDKPPRMWETLSVGGTSFRECGKHFPLARQASANVGSTSRCCDELSANKKSTARQRTVLFMLEEKIAQFCNFYAERKDLAVL